MAKPGKTGIARILKATQYSWQGLRAAWKHEASFRQELILVIVGVPLAFWFAENKFELLWLILPLFILVIAELVNSALEAVVDRIGHEYHELSGRAKDIGSAIVLVSILLLVTIWSIVLYYHVAF